MAAGLFTDVSRLCSVFESLIVIAHPAVDDALRSAADGVRRWVNAWAGSIRAAGYLDGSSDTVCAEARAEVIEKLDLISRARVLQGLIPGKFLIEAVHRECVDFVQVLPIPKP